MEMKLAPVNILQWAEENKECFAPPICNKLMHKDQLSIMLVGGPNSRTDFHLEEGSELFLQLKGNMQLPTIQGGNLKIVDIPEGSLFVLPSRIPHSPQRTADSLGLVIERGRLQGEYDALMWYVDFTSCSDKLFERYFICQDLGKDLVPVVNEYKASSEFSTRAKTETSLCPNPPCKQDLTTIIPDPVNLQQFIRKYAEDIAAGKIVDFMKESQQVDKEFKALLVGGEAKFSGCQPLDLFLYQACGCMNVDLSDSGSQREMLSEGSCMVISAKSYCGLSGDASAVTLLIMQDPYGNKQGV